MKTLRILVLLSMIMNYAMAQTFQWAHGYGYWTSDYAADVVVDHEGFVTMTGYAEPHTMIGTFEKQYQGIYIARFDPNGAFVWAKESQGAFNTQATGIVCDNQNNIIVTGYYSSSISFEGIQLPGAVQPRMFLVKYDQNGNLQWAKSFGSTGDTQRTYTNSLTTDQEGMIYVTGAFNRFLAFGDIILESKNSASTSHFDIFIAKIDQYGNPVWAKRMGGNYNDYAYSVQFDPSGYIYASGVFQPKDADFGSILLNQANTSSKDYIVKLDTGGNAFWVTHGETATGGYAETSNIKTDPKGNVYGYGNYYGPFIYGKDTLNDMGHYLLKLDSAGNKVFIREIQTSYDLASYMEGTWWRKQGDIVTDQEGNVFIASGYSDTLVLENDTLISEPTQYGWGSADVFVAKYNEIGYPQWAVSAGGSWHDYANSIAIDTSNLYFCGYYSSVEAAFGDTAITNNSGNLDHDFYLAGINDTTENECPEINPSVFPSSFVICGTDSVLITCESNYGSSFQWIINDTVGVFQYSNELWAKDSMLVYVIVNPNTVCPDTSNTIRLIHHPKPIVNITAAPDTIVCPGSAVELSTFFDPAYQYSWYLDTLLISSGFNLVQATSDGIYFVWAADSLCSDSDSIILTSKLFPEIELPIDTLNTYHLPMYFDAGQSEDQFTWYYYSTDSIPLSYESLVLFNQQGMYYVLLSNECGTDIDSIYVKDLTYEIEEPGKQNDPFVIFPNPANTHLTLLLSRIPEMAKVSIYSMEGICLSTYEITNETTEISLGELPAGIYYFRVLFDNTVRVIRFSKQ